ncbi:MAG: hypothetical protein HYZ40_12020 [Rhodospirillales bacterium]|nr:hypothetical protein [Rhodospirillales bacterium]
MVVVIVRVMTALLALVCFSASTIAQPAAPTVARVPDTHPTTGLKFPSVIGGDTRLARSIDHGQSEARPEFGYSLTYLVAPPVDGVARVNVFNGGLTSIPPDTSSTLVAEQFEQLLAEIRALTPEADGLKIVKSPAECLVGGIAFRCATLLAVTAKTQVPIYSTLLVTAYRNHFFTIWLEWNGTKADPSAAQAYLNTLVTAMVR